MKLKCKIIDELISMLGFTCDSIGQIVITSKQLETTINQILQKIYFLKSLISIGYSFLEKVKSNAFKNWSSKSF